MIQKSINIVVVILLLATTTGYSISKHYCGKSLISISVNEKAESCCGSECSSCRDEIQHYQIEDNFIQALSADIGNLSIHDLSFPILILQTPDDFSGLCTCIYYIDDSSPPINQVVSLAFLQTYLL